MFTGIKDVRGVIEPPASVIYNSTNHPRFPHVFCIYQNLDGGSGFMCMDNYLIGVSRAEWPVLSVSKGGSPDSPFRPAFCAYLY